MNERRPDIKVALAAGFEPTWCIKGVIGSTSQFAARHNLYPSHVSGVINGSTPIERPQVVLALAEECRVERWYMEDLVRDIRQNYLSSRT